MKNLVTLVWWPHSGGRWLSRSIIRKNSKVSQTTFVHPWIFNSSDEVLSSDITEQVHKARSLPELSQNLRALYESTEHGRIEGLKKYFSMIKEYKFDESVQVILGESCMGAPNPKPIELDALYQAWPEMKMIHLVRNPLDTFDSFKSRNEMDGDPIKIALSWITLNSLVRSYFEEKGRMHKDKYLLVRYEDLIKETKKTVQIICQFLEIEFESNMISDLGERWGKLTEIKQNQDIRKLMKSIAFVEMKKYGYL